MVLLQATVQYPLTNVFGFYLFHGFAYRPDVRFPLSPNHFMGDVISTPLHLDRTSGFFPPICKPGNLIVDDMAKALFKGLPNVDSAECVIGRLAKVPFNPAQDGRIKFDRISFDVSPELFHDCFPVDVDTRPPRYYELLVHRIHLVSKVKKMPIYQGLDQTGESRFELEIDPLLSEQYPILRVFDGLVFRDDVYEATKHLMPSPYFSVFTLTPK